MVSDRSGNIYLVNIDERKVVLLTGTLDSHLQYTSIPLKANSLFITLSSNNYLKLFDTVSGE